VERVTAEKIDLISNYSRWGIGQYYKMSGNLRFIFRPLLGKRLGKNHFEKDLLRTGISFSHAVRVVSCSVIPSRGRENAEAKL
jgi:hypothetical protein